jgi:hypothetical protein
MPHKLNRYHRYYLKWLYPLIFIALTFYAIKQDNLDKKPVSLTNPNVNVDSTISLNKTTRIVDSLKSKRKIYRTNLLIAH